MRNETNVKKIWYIKVQMKTDKNNILFEQFKRFSIVGYVVFFIVFSLFATMYNISTLNQSFFHTSENSLNSIEIALYADKVPDSTDTSNSMPMQPLVEEELEHQTTKDDGHKLASSLNLYTNLVHDHFYLNSLVHKGYGQLLYRPPAQS